MQSRGKTKTAEMDHNTFNGGLAACAKLVTVPAGNHQLQLLTYQAVPEEGRSATSNGETQRPDSEPHFSIFTPANLPI